MWVVQTLLKWLNVLYIFKHFEFLNFLKNNFNIVKILIFQNEKFKKTKLQGLNSKKLKLSQNGAKLPTTQGNTRLAAARL